MVARHALRIILLALMTASAFFVPGARADEAKSAKSPELPAALVKPAPDGVEDLRAIQKQVRSVVDKVIPCTVNIRAGRAQGSGVIVSADGYVLTAGHVSAEAGRDVVLTLHDGKTVKGKTLGANRAIDSGMVKITDAGPWPFAAMGHSADLKKGQWCVTTGHPNGYVKGRPPVVRLGRVLDGNDNLVRTDCTIVGGDSGGPLFDMRGRVVGIHSRIGGPLTANIHVPVDTFRDTWDPLAKGEVWWRPWLGFEGDVESTNCKVEKIGKDSPAEKGGLLPNDVITRFDGKEVKTFGALKTLLSKKKPTDQVEVEVQRGDETVTLKLVIGSGKQS